MGGVYLCFRVLSIALILLAFAICANTALCDQIPFRSPSWSTPDEVIDLAVSADGSIVAVATYEEGLKVYAADGDLLWSWNKTDVAVTSVDVSDDGNVVAAAIENNTESPSVSYQLLFWKNAKTLSGTPQPNWSSDEPIGWIEPEALAVSSDGNQVVVVGTGPNVYYWNDTLTLSGGSIPITWGSSLPNWLEYVDISDDGDVVAVLGFNVTGKYPEYYVFVYKNCRSRTGLTNPPDLEDYCGSSSVPGTIALSDDGMYLVAGVAAVYFFNTTELEPWSPQWTCTPEPLLVSAVDISDDGSTVVAVFNILQGSPLMLAIFHNAQLKTGIVPCPDVSFVAAGDYTEHDYKDVALDGLGRVAVGGTGDYVFAVNASTGEPLWYYNGIYPLVSRFVKVSEDGSAVVTAGGEIDSLYYFRLAAAPPAVGGLISPRIPTIVNITTLTVLLIAVVGMLIITVKGKLR